MLIILFLLAFIRTLHGVPISPPLEAPVLFIRDAGEHLGRRTVSDIVTSCVATIFACTWSAVHPNVPAPDDSGWTCFKRQFVTMVYALLAPEAITAWALRQRLGAKKIMKAYNEDEGEDLDKQKSNYFLHIIRGFFQDPPPPAGGAPRWTLTHGFFLQMGGFMLSEDGRPIQTLAPLRKDQVVEPGRFSPDIKTNIDNHVIDPPLTTKEDIQDRSKGDFISKSLIILQTTWFIVQCTARWFNQLPVSELEVVTLGFALLNGVTCYFWWHKPQSVGRPVFLEIKPDQRTLVSYPSPVESMATDFSSSTATLVSLVQTDAQCSTDDGQTCSEKQAVTPRKKPYPQRTLSKDFEEHSSRAPWKLLWLLPLHVVGALLRPIGKLAEAEVDGHLARSTVRCGAHRVPMFFSAEVDDEHVHGPTALIGVLFGMVHLTTSWTLAFASAEQMLMWRCASVVITVAPVFLMLWGPGRVLVKVIVAVWLVMYIVGRVVLLWLSLISLRNLSPAALQTIDWTTFLPHI
ncbi:hypothetical protein BJ912DRAFT_967721 [Pholiota molesta]|nr:hypothetical protein BJ912DRAFT_967721 [Pholiota molesta]